jgi:hypothetical protein
MNINERILRIIEAIENGRRYSFAKKIGKSRQQVSNLINNGYKVGFTIINDILAAYPELSPEWLMTGEGKMLKSQSIENVKNSTIIGGNVQGSNVQGSNNTFNMNSKMLESSHNYQEIIKKHQEHIEVMQKQMNMLLEQNVQLINQISQMSKLIEMLSMK